MKIDLKKNTVALQSVFSNSRTTAVDKNPWGTDVMQRNICVSQLKFDRTLLSLHMQKASGKTTGPTVQNCKGQGEREANQVKLYSHYCLFAVHAKATFVHDCNCK